MKQRVLLVALATFVFAMTSLATTALAQGNGTKSTQRTISGQYYNPCCDEMITITGTAHLTRKTTTNADGSVTTTTRFNAAGIRGVGQSSGINYNFIESGHLIETTTPAASYPYSQDLEYMDNLVGKGKGGHACSAKVKVSVHVEIDADGNITMNISDIQFICANGTEIN
jgi:hypothetical protein